MIRTPLQTQACTKMLGFARARTPLVLVQTQLPSPPHAAELLQELEIPSAAPGASANLGSPIALTPFFCAMQYSEFQHQCHIRNIRNKKFKKDGGILVVI